MGDPAFSVLARGAPGQASARERTIDIEVLLRKHLGSLVNRVSTPVEDASEHVLRHRQLHAAPRELYVRRLDVDSGRALEHLHDRLAARDFEHLAPANGSVGKSELDAARGALVGRVRTSGEDEHLVVGGELDVVEDDERTCARG